jgi:hypothetical protein
MIVCLSSHHTSICRTILVTASKQRQVALIAICAAWISMSLHFGAISGLWRLSSTLGVSVQHPQEVVVPDEQLLEEQGQFE